MIEAKTMENEAKTKEIEAKCLSKAEIKELITDECSKNTCQNAKRPINGRPNRRPGKNHRRAAVPGRNLRRPAQNGQSIAYYGDWFKVLQR